MGLIGASGTTGWIGSHVELPYFGSLLIVSRCTWPSSSPTFHLGSLTSLTLLAVEIQLRQTNSRRFPRSYAVDKIRLSLDNYNGIWFAVTQVYMGRLNL